MPTTAYSDESLPPTGTTARATALMRNYRRRKAEGRKGEKDLVPIFAVQHVITTLRQAGFSYGRIAEISGYTKRRIQEYHGGRQSHVTYGTHQRFMALDLEHVIDTEHPRVRSVPARPYRERLRRLGAAGWSKQDLQAFVSFPLVEHHVWNEKSRYITMGRARELDAMFAQIGDKLGTNQQTSLYWRRRGYGPPAAYDEDSDEMAPGAVEPPPPTQAETRKKRRLSS